MSTDLQILATPPARVVPNGKVYRQMFDAQVQLHRSLTGGSKKQKRCVSREATSTSFDLTTVPLVHLKRDDTCHGLLNTRQKTWIDSFPNDPHVENPVLFKEHDEVLKAEYKKGEWMSSKKEVRGLPDIVVPAKTGSDIINRIAASRKERHEAAVEDMQQELSVITTELEPKIIELSQIVLHHLEEDDEEIAKLLASFENDEDLLTFNKESMGQLWQEIQAHSSARLDRISEVDVKLKDIENHRMEMIQSIFYTYSRNFAKIAHLMPPDLQRFLDREAQMINQTMLSNQRAYADLFVRLMSADVEREKSQHTIWRKRVEDWKRLKTDLAIKEFQEFMKTDDIENPPGVEKVLQFMIAEQQMLNSKRLELLESLKEMKPPASTKTAIYKWNEQMQAITMELDAVNQMHMSKLHQEYEKVCKDCLDHMEDIKDHLIESDVSDHAKALQVVTNHMLPLIGERQNIFEANLEKMEKRIEHHNYSINAKIRTMFKFAQGAAHVWDVHEIGLAKQERKLQEKLEFSRNSHNNYNQEREANLDIVMDRMRQSAHEIDLQENIVVALDMLDKLRMSYEVFHNQQTEIVKSYPMMAKFELKGYDTIVCNFFNVDRTKTKYRRKTFKCRRNKSNSNKDSSGNAVDESEDDTPPHSAGRDTPDETGRETPVDESERGTPVNESERGTPVDKSGRETPKTPVYGSGRQTPVDGSGRETPIDGRETPKTPVDGSGRQTPVSGSGKQTPVAESGKNTPEDVSERHLQESTVEKPPSCTLPSIINDTLLTEKGTTFYVITDPNGDSIPADPPVPIPENDSIPQYIRSMDLTSHLLLLIKQKMRMNFLNHLEEWEEEAMERANSVVVAKCEELNSELDLRLHLHEPRSRRARLDVHNVRAAELVMHSERVVRHCKGIELSLFDLKDEFTKMSYSHDKLTKKFKDDIEALDNIFISATKSSRLIALQNQLSLELDKFMSVIRISLRQFRQHLDETLQMLRESNARFIKSFKVFSDGGNFCPVEIEDYRKRLEKMSHKIDENEGSIMSDLEGMESKRLDQGTKVALEFEDRFKNHMFDLIFMEKIARWFTNTQVKIKSEVANSNRHALELVQSLTDIERRIDACEKPNLDKEQITSAELDETVQPLMDAFHARSTYLNCISIVLAAVQSGVPTINQSTVTRVGFAYDSPAVSKPGKQPSEDPSVSVIKSIFKTNKSKKFGSEAYLDADITPHVVPSALMTGVQDLKASTSTKLGRRGTLSAVHINHQTESGMSQVKRIPSGTTMRTKGFKIEKKYLVFGERDEDNEDSHLLGIVKKILRDANDGLLSHAEVYYRQKGNRAVTRPQYLPETFEGCAEVVVAKLLSYLKQTTEYHNQCLQEFRTQLVEMEDLVYHVPLLVIKEIATEDIKKAQLSQDSLQSKFSEILIQLKDRQDNHKNQLRPTLGHPHQKDALLDLCNREAVRHTDYLAAVETETKSRQETAVSHAKVFLEKLMKMTDIQLAKYNGLLVVDDVEKGRVEVKRFPTSELFRRQNAGQPLFEEDDKHARKRGKTVWKGVPINELVVRDKHHKIEFTPSITTTITTQGHSATMKGRDLAYKLYRNHFLKTLDNIQKEKERLELAEQRWMDNWNISVEKIKRLY